MITPTSPPAPSIPGKTGAVILARLDSSRLPGKGLMQVLGKPALGYVFERVRQVRGLNEVVLATSERAVDDGLEGLAREWDLPLFRGSLEDVAGRVLACARERGYDAFLRVNGDSPFFDFHTAGQGLDIFRQGDHHVVTNVLERTYPPGMSVEVIDTLAFAHGYKRMTEPGHREHVTKFFYEHAGEYLIHNLASPDPSWAKVHLALDTAEDLARMTWILENLGKDHLDAASEEIIDLARRFPG